MAASTFSQDIISTSEISEAIRSLQVISCDFCKVGKASYDVFVDGKVRMLKRCCEQCFSSINAGRQQ